TLTPTITWRFTDPDGDRQSAYQIIIREGAVEVDNSGKVTNSTSSYTVPVNKLRSNTIYNYTVKVWDQTDEASQDSVVQYFKTRQAPTAEPKYPLGPSANPVRVPTLTPTINWRYIDPEGLAQEKFQVKIYNAEDDHIVYDTGEILSDSDDFDYVVPAGKLTAGKTYYWTIQVWNINTNSDVTEPQYFKTS
ncbi:hypothetical protein, partial [Brevibacillus sp. SYSU BS000544]|uniref:glycoside hydrolase family 78 protein n=1 Tax=Brevibacillus sp. SYSU BS000544 TaxID=3416443 RepID=UPI003CE46531